MKSKNIEDQAYQAVEMGEIFGVSFQAISKIAKHQRWG